MNLVDVGVSIAGPVVLVTERRVVISATGVEIEDGNVILDELEEESEGDGGFVLEKENDEADVGGGGGGVGVTGGGVEQDCLGVLCSDMLEINKDAVMEDLCEKGAWYRIRLD